LRFSVTNKFQRSVFDALNFTYTGIYHFIVFLFRKLYNNKSSKTLMQINFYKIIYHSYLVLAPKKTVCSDKWLYLQTLIEVLSLRQRSVGFTA